MLIDAICLARLTNSVVLPKRSLLRLKGIVRSEHAEAPPCGGASCCWIILRRDVTRRARSHVGVGPGSHRLEWGFWLMECSRGPRVFFHARREIGIAGDGAEVENLVHVAVAVSRYYHFPTPLTPWGRALAPRVLLAAQRFRLLSRRSLMDLETRRPFDQVGRDQGPLVVVAEFARHLDRASDLDPPCVAEGIFLQNAQTGSFPFAAGVCADICCLAAWANPRMQTIWRCWTERSARSRVSSNCFVRN